MDIQIDDRLREAITRVYDDGAQNWDRGDGWPPRDPEIREAYKLVRQLTTYHLEDPFPDDIEDRA